MHIDIHRHSDTSLSNQIYFSIIDHIQSGLLQQGDKPPTVRDLAKQLNVSLVTAKKGIHPAEGRRIFNDCARKRNVCG